MTPWQNILAKFCALLLLFSLTLSAHANESVNYDALFEAQADSQALNTLAERIAGGHSTLGEFTQYRYLKVLNKPLISHGKFIFQDGLGIAWLQTSPFNTTLVLTQGSLIQIDAEGYKQVSQAQDNQQASAMAQVMPKLMSALLKGDIAPISTHFYLHLLQDDQCWRLGLIPKDPLVRQAMPRLVLQGADQLASLTLLDNKGDRSVIEFRQIESRPLTLDEQAYFAIDPQTDALRPQTSQ